MEGKAPRAMTRSALALARTALAFDLPKSNLARSIRKGAEAAGIDTAGLCFHSLRHTLATASVKAGVSPRAARAVMRHSEARLSLGVYVHARPARRPPRGGRPACTKSCTNARRRPSRQVVVRQGRA